MREKGPDCGNCFPGIHLNNLDAWKVFQRYSSPLGIDSGVILSLCKSIGIQDEIETLDKVLDLLGMIDAQRGQKS